MENENPKHTPGPWHVGKSFVEKMGELEFRGFPISGHGWAIARVWTTEPLDHPQIIRRAAAVPMEGMDVGRLDHEHVSLPMAP